MNQAITDFFRNLARREHDPRLDKVRGTVRFDIRDGTETEQWLVTVDQGVLHVSREMQREADGVIVADAAQFERNVRGEANATAAMLRGDLLIRGELRLLTMLERIFPSPPGTRGPRHIRQEESR